MQRHEQCRELDHWNRAYRIVLIEREHEHRIRDGNGWPIAVHLLLEHVSLAVLSNGHCERFRHLFSHGDRC